VVEVVKDNDEVLLDPLKSCYDRSDKRFDVFRVCSTAAEPLELVQKPDTPGNRRMKCAKSA
jgi:hypothetical protein